MSQHERSPNLESPNVVVSQLPAANWMRPHSHGPHMVRARHKTSKYQLAKQTPKFLPSQLFVAPQLLQLQLLLILCSCAVKLSHQQSSISLNTAQWFVSNSNGSLVLPALVPGGIYSDLRRANVLKQEILAGKNDLAYRWVGHENWTYTSSFAIDQQIAMSQSVKLVLHGVDTVASVYLNGEEIGTTDNMFVRYKFDVKPYLKLAGLKNILVIKFESPIKYSLRRFQQSLRQNRGKIIPPYCAAPAQRGECHVNFIRKMQASFSWDWGPAFPSMGIYKNIEVEYGSFGVIRDILVETRRLTPLVTATRQPLPAPQVIVSSSLRHNIRAPMIYNKSVPYVRAPPYYVPMRRYDPTADETLALDSPPPAPPQRIEIHSESLGESSGNSQQQPWQLTDDQWLLKITLVAEMVQPSFGYNVRIEFNLNGVLHYESEHINVVANSDGFIRLGFNLRIDTTRMRVRPWWPNNAGSQPLYRLTARMMPIPSSPEQARQQARAAATAAPPMSLDQPADRAQLASQLQARAKPLQTPAVPPMIYLATPVDMSAHLIQQVSEKEIQFGFRTVELIQEPITRGNLDDGLTFQFRVNGLDLFAMGSNWIPASVLPENHHDLDYIRYLLQSAKDANMNMLRVWGGGLYESDEFYQLADEMGIMIWHDFMFACALYPIDDDYIASVRLEIEQQVQRLQHHPSIVLWAGNNENEMAIAGTWWPEVLVWSRKLRESYHKLYVETIRPIVQVLDPTRPYVVSSPSNGLMSESQPNAIARVPNDPKYGDMHHYDYLTDSFDWTVYPSTRFASEYGFQSYPSFNAITSFSGPGDWKYPLSSTILNRQHRLTGETEMKLQMKVHFNELKSGGADKLKTFIYVSQLTQAIAIKTETEFYRRNRLVDPETKLGRTMGALYWQLNDVWQAPTWSSIEYGGKWKMLHYFARRFFFPIQVMPYIIQPSMASTLSNTIQQVLSGNGVLSSLRLGSQQQSQQSQSSSSASSQYLPLSYPQQDGMSPLQPPYLQQQQQQQQRLDSSPAGPILAIDLVRDDVFDLLDSFNVTIRFFRWTSFAPVWQDTVYVRNTRPGNVTRIFEQDTLRLMRQPGVIQTTNGVFQVVIEQQPRLGLSAIENYLMPVAPNKVTAMRVAKIVVEDIQGPFELTDVAAGRWPSGDVGGGGGGASSTSSAWSSASQWSCAYRLTLISDSIAMFVWLDLNFLNASREQGGAAAANGNDQPPHGQPTPSAADGRRPTAAGNIQLEALPQSGAAAAHLPPEHIRLHVNNHNGNNDQGAANGLLMSQMDRRQPAELYGGETSALASETSELVIAAKSGEQAESAPPLLPPPTQLDVAQQQAQHSHNNVHRLETQTGQAAAATRLKRQAMDSAAAAANQLPERLILNVNQNGAVLLNNGASPSSSSQTQPHPSMAAAAAAASQRDGDHHHHHQQQQHITPNRQRLKPAREPPVRFKPVDGSGGQLLRYQFSDNAFNMFESSKVIDLYLSRCLSKAQVEVALEIQSLADCL